MKKTLSILSLSILFCMPARFSWATTASNTAPDNSSQNKRESITADQQKMNQSDTDLTARIRRDLLKDSRLSTYAHNVKIITMDGKITLKGPVKSASEKETVENMAIAVVGANNVSSEITISN